MPSTNVNVGLLEGRSSCRVLKPPGGGHSDIFGRGDSVAEKFVPKKGAAHMSGIQGCLYQTNDNPKDTEGNGVGHAVAEEVATTEEANGKEKEVVDSAEDTKKKAPEPVVAVAAAPKVRVPPGGFSSGSFW